MELSEESERDSEEARREWDGGKVLIAGTLALVFAMFGARAGEKLTGNL